MGRVVATLGKFVKNMLQVLWRNSLAGIGNGNTITCRGGFLGVQDDFSSNRSKFHRVSHQIDKDPQEFVLITFDNPFFRDWRTHKVNVFAFNQMDQFGIDTIHNMPNRKRLKLKVHLAGFNF